MSTSLSNPSLFATPALYPDENVRTLLYAPTEYLVLARGYESSPASCLRRGEWVHTPHGVGRVMRADRRRGAIVNVVVEMADAH